MSDEYVWKWCELCRTGYIECPKCGNNCCNGGYGEVDGETCDKCESAYEYQERESDPFRERATKAWEKRKREIEEENKEYENS